MSDQGWRRIEEICHQALEHLPDRRAAFVRDACAGDTALRAEVESLLANQSRADALGTRFGIEDSGLGSISSQGGDFARWGQDGQELFYTAPDGTLMSVPVQQGPNSLNLGEPKPLFKITGRAGTYDVAPDGQRILALPPSRDDAGPSMTVFVNWPTLLKKGR